MYKTLNTFFIFQHENNDGAISYVGFNAETISVIAEQFLNEKIDTNACEALAEDISYKMRELLNVIIVFCTFFHTE